MLASFDTGEAGFQFASTTRGSSRGGSRGTSASTASRCSSWCSPACCSRWRSSASTRTTTSSRTSRGCCCCRPADRHVPRARPVRVLHLLRDRARADVLPHRRVGLREPRLRGHEVLPVHDVRLGVHARRPDRHRRPGRASELGHTTFDLVEIADGANFAASTGRWLFFAFAIAFAVKVPMFPVHTWLPDAHTQAPTAGSIVLAGVMLKLGTYGFLRFGLDLFPEAVIWSRPFWLTLAVIGIVYGAVVATMQMDLKRLVAYSSVAHLGFIILGTFAVTTQCCPGAVLQMINHGVSTGALFLLVGWIYERRSHAQDLRAEGPPEGRPDLRRRLHARDALLDRRARAQRLRRRVPDPHRLVPHGALVDRGRRHRRDPRRALPALGLPAGVPRRARRGEQALPRALAARKVRCCCRSWRRSCSWASTRSRSSTASSRASTS